MWIYARSDAPRWFYPFFRRPVTGATLDIGAGLAKAALAITVDGQARDLEYLIETDAAVSILTEPRKNAEPDSAALELLRHSTARDGRSHPTRGSGNPAGVRPTTHRWLLLRHRVPEERPLPKGDFEAIEAEMDKIVGEDRPFTRYELSQSDGLEKTPIRRASSKSTTRNLLLMPGHQPVLVRHWNPGRTLGRSLPWPPSAVHRSHRCLQVDVFGKQLLARRCEL